MHMYEHMNDVLDIMWGNLMEAEKYIKQAHELHDECRMYADWCHAMATRHIEFNTDGKAVYLTYNLTELSALRGTVIANHGYTIIFPITTASARATRPGQK